jgi:hypothetical protein
MAESIEAKNNLNADFKVDEAISDIASIIPPTGTHIASKPDKIALFLVQNILVGSAHLLSL